VRRQSREARFRACAVLNRHDPAIASKMTSRKEIGTMGLIIVIVVLVLLFGGGGGYYYGHRSGWGTPHYGGGLVGLVLIVLLILWLTGNLGGPMMR
jgi:hypothetical protein